MIDQNILYAECPCGSGKKFKFCCYPDIRSELPRDPSRADVTDLIRRRSQVARQAEMGNSILTLDLDRFHKIIANGLMELNVGHYRDARRIFLTAKKEFGMLPTAYNNLALCALVQGDLKEAEKWAQEVYRLFPLENPFGMALLADIRYLKGDVIGALEMIANAERIVPPSVDQAARLCESMAHFKSHQRIIDYTEKSGYADAPPVALFRGIALANLNRHADAEKSLRFALQGQQGDYARQILDDLMANRRPKTICGDWMYFRPESFSLFAGLMKNITEKGASQAGLSSELIAEFVEVEANAGVLDLATAIDMLKSTMGKRSEQILDALRTNEAQPEDIRKKANATYEKLFAKGGVGKRLRNADIGFLQQTVITNEAATPLAIDPAHEESYFKAVNLALDPMTKKKDLKEAERLFSDLYAKFPDNPSVANNYASVLARLGRIEEAIAIIRDCFAKHPDYVFGAAAYLNMLISTFQMEAAKAMIENYRLPLRIHPDAYRAWCTMEMRYYELTGETEMVRNLKRALTRIDREFAAAK